MRNYLAILAGILIISLGAGFLVSRMSQQVISKPIVRLAETAQAISRDQNYSVRATPIANRDEIAVLIDSFNKMPMEIQKRDTALQQSEEQFRMLADSVPQLAWMAEPDGHIFWYDQRCMTTPEPRRSR